MLVRLLHVKSGRKTSIMHVRTRKGQGMNGALTTVQCLIDDIGSPFTTRSVLPNATQRSFARTGLYLVMNMCMWRAARHIIVLHTCI